MPEPGESYIYCGDTGLAAAARVADPNVDDHLTSEHAELDMAPGAVVTVCGVDEDRGLVLVEWADLQGNPRVTSIDPVTFADQFRPEG